MQRYVNQLIEDIRNAAKNTPTKPYLEVPEEMEGLEYILEWENAKTKPMKDWFKLEKEMFPPSNKLDSTQLTALVEELTALWKAYNFDPVLPENLPAVYTYDLMVKFMDEPVEWASEGTMFIEFCSYEPGNCPFPDEYCMCKEFDENMSFGSDNAKNIEWINAIKSALEFTYHDMVKKMRYDQLVILFHQRIEKMIRQVERVHRLESRPLKQFILEQAELLSRPFITLQELTGINKRLMPDNDKLTLIQVCEMLTDIFRLMDIYNVAVLFPYEVPPEVLYDHLQQDWDKLYVQHLEESGFDLDLCVGEKKNCPFRCFCDCFEDHDDEITDLPPDIL